VKHAALGAIATALLFSAGAHAAEMTKAEYKSGNDRIALDYKAAKEACKSLSGNAADVCKLQAAGQSKTAKADLTATYKPSIDSRYKAAVARAKADYAVAKERCDDLAGNVKDVCVKEAKAVEVASLADAKAQMKVSDANATAFEKRTDARKDATSDKRDADYAVAKQKCDTYAGDAKTRCVDEAKAAFGKT
jgi:hypothetical protein